MKTLTAASLSLLITFAVFGQTPCTNTLEVDADTGAGSTAGTVFVTLDGQCNATIPTIAVGDAVKIESGGKQFSADTKKVTVTPKFVFVTAVAAGPAAEDSATLTQLENGGTATVTFGTDAFSATIVNGNILNISRYEWSIGPATKSSTDTTAATPTASPLAAAADPNSPDEGAFRLTYEGEYARPGLLGRGGAAAKFQTIGTLSIDTTNSDDPGYLDNNELKLGLRSLDINTPAFLAQTHFGIEGQITRSFHQDAQDANVMATFSTWIPALQSKTIFSSGPAYISPPLAITLSYGYGNKQVPGAAKISGKTGEATAAYYLYAFDKYQLTLAGTWTLNDMSNRPATIPRTQRLYKIGVAYLTDPAKGFEVVTSFEDGSIGPLLTKVRQYYIGMAMKKFSLSGGSK
jgi:hypothetical protein